MLFQLPLPQDFCGVWELKHHGCGEEGDCCRHERLCLNLMPAPGQLVGGVLHLGCILVVLSFPVPQGEVRMLQLQLRSFPVMHFQ